MMWHWQARVLSEDHRLSLVLSPRPAAEARLQSKRDAARRRSRRVKNAEDALRAAAAAGAVHSSPQDTATAKLTVLPAPIPGCVRTSGVADQGGITWPTHFEWILKKQADGCWMLDTMNSEPPPMGDVADAEPLLASHYEAA